MPKITQQRPELAQVATSDQESSDRSALALDALSKLTKQFADKPNLQTLIRTLLLTFSGQFSVPSTFSLLRGSESIDHNVSYNATGKFASDTRLQTLILSPQINRYFQKHRYPCFVSDLNLPEDCSNYGSILHDCHVELVCPLVYGDKLLGIIGLGQKATRKQFSLHDVDLLHTLLNVIQPLIVGFYHFHEMASLSAWYLDVLDNVKQGVFVFDIENRLLKANASGFRLLRRFNPDINNIMTVQGVPVDEVFPEKIFKGWAQQFMKTNVKDQGKLIENLVAENDTGEFIHEAYLTSISGGSEFKTDFIVTLEDVTERVRSERALRRSEERFRKQFEETSDAIFLADADTGILIDCNPAALALVNRDKKELIGKDQKILHPPETIEGEFSKIFKEYLGGKEGQVLETQVITKTGEIRQVAIKANLFKFEQTTVIQEVFHDITKRIQNEEQQQKLREQLERAERMESLGILAGGVAHDLNNMLGPLVGYPELILLKLPEESPIRRQVERIGNSAREAANVVQDLLTLARRGKYDMVPTDLNEIVNDYFDSAGFLKQKETHPDISIRTDLDHQLGSILGSSTHLSKVIMNLVVNAFDAMPQGGELSVATEQQHLEKLLGGSENITSGDFVLFRVKDTGTGIDPKDVERIFEPYYSKKKMGASGSGLGLSVVHGIVNDHKGYCDILSTVGKGTEFILYFPVTKVQFEDNRDSELNYEGSEKVLVVDDVADQRDIASDLLSSLGYHVATACCGREAVRYLENHKVDIVLLDMIMEKDFDGLRTYQEIIKQHAGQKAIIISGYSATDRVKEMQKLGAGQYVRKPYSREAIGQAVRQELDMKSITASS